MRGEQPITLIGMSNVGKSYWSERLAKEKGFRHINCDDMIEAELEDVLKQFGYQGIADMSKWLGQPYEKRFATNQQTYLELEQACVETVLGELEQSPARKNIVIDTTGSVVHLASSIRQRLKSLSLVIYIETPVDEQQKMFEKYLAEPKPVVFGEIYQPKSGETGQQTLARCYPKLLAYLSALYKDMAHITIQRLNLENLHKAGEFLDLVRESLPY